MSPKGPPFEFFVILLQNACYKSKKSPLLHFSALCDISERNFFFQKIQVFSKKNVCSFLSLRYSADLRRSRLVSTTFMHFLKHSNNCFKLWFFEFEDLLDRQVINQCLTGSQTKAPSRRVRDNLPRDNMPKPNLPSVNDNLQIFLRKLSFEFAEFVEKICRRSSVFK